MARPPVGRKSVERVYSAVRVKSLSVSSRHTTRQAISQMMALEGTCGSTSLDFVSIDTALPSLDQEPMPAVRRIFIESLGSLTQLGRQAELQPYPTTP